LMSADEIADCATRGMSIQLHTHRHRIEHDGHLVLKDELKRNRDSLAPLARERLEHFCYPSGEYDERAWPVLESEMIVSATTTDLGFVTPAAKKFALPRILDGQEVSELEFEAELCGVGEVKRRLARFVRPGATNKRTD
jgi:peptidoglycan/xylan/chitin deacetylase (PgdA/CDA1 family)